MEEEEEEKATAECVGKGTKSQVVNIIDRYYFMGDYKIFRKVITITYNVTMIYCMKT